MALFEKGQGGRPKGVRNKLSGNFLADAYAEWQVSGPAALRIMAKEDPCGFVKVMASLLPKQMQIGPMGDLDDRELDGLIALVEQRLQPQAIIPRVITYERAPEMEAIDRERFDDIEH